MSEIANQSEEVQPQETFDAETEAVYAAFDLPAPKEQKEIDVQFPDVNSDPATTEEPPTTEEQPPADGEAKRTLRLKYNGEEKEVDEEEARTLAQKGMNYDKVQQKLQEQQQALDEVAQLQGFKDHAELLAQLPRLREQQQKQKESEFQNLRSQLVEEYESYGYDPSKLEAYLDNHPILQEANRILESQQQLTIKSQQDQTLSRWNELYSMLPEGAEKPDLYFSPEGTLMFNSPTVPTWYNSDIQSKIERGYDPVDAFQIANMGNMTAQAKKQAEQRTIKEQQLGVRAQVEKSGAADADPNDLLPAQVQLAELFGVPIEEVKRQQKLISRR